MYARLVVEGDSNVISKLLTQSPQNMFPMFKTGDKFRKLTNRSISTLFSVDTPDLGEQYKRILRNIDASTPYTVTLDIIDPETWNYVVLTPNELNSREYSWLNLNHVFVDVKRNIHEIYTKKSKQREKVGQVAAKKTLKKMYQSRYTRYLTLREEAEQYLTSETTNYEWLDELLIIHIPNSKIWKETLDHKSYRKFDLPKLDGRLVGF